MKVPRKSFAVPVVPAAILLFLLLLNALLWLGCSKKTDAGHVVAPKQRETPFTEFPYPASDYIASEPGRPGGTLKVTVGTDLQIVDNQVALGGHWWGRLIGDFLTYVDDKGVVGPYLATSWEVSPDGLTYTFHLRRDVTFSDGEKFNAEAVRVNLARIRDPATKGALSTALLEPYVDGKVVDEFTFEAHLREPFRPFLHTLATSYFCMLSPKALRENPKGLVEKPISTGPFIVESYTRNKGIVFVKRPDYDWSPPLIRHKGPAYLDRIEVDIVPEPLIRYTSLASGQYDMTLDAAPQTAASIRADPTLVLENRIITGNPMRGPIFNTEKAPFDDVRVRKAFALAVDREGIGKIMGFGELKLKTDFLSSNSAYYDPSFKDVLKYDVAEANRLLDEAGWTGRDSEGFRTKNNERLGAEVILNQNETASTLVAIQSDMKSIGFDLKIVQVPSAQRLAMVDSNNYQAMRPSFAYTGNTPDGLYIHYHSVQINTGKFIGQNASRTRDPLLDDLLSRARRSQDEAELKTLYSQAQKRLVELVPAVPLYEYQAMTARKTYVKGVLYDTSSNRTLFTTVWLDKQP